ncbi:MAG: hypothetical protein H8E79_09060 [Desulfobulbaceae bacterium]|uniref:Lipoprotein n=1 Tax=Candidatus Desulfatifera sulfidica TaxID=2841691 RepID=A0A8J6N7G8_9BACT|nr:hypothetical protein [Candidatus Desulfatifera sulfidica]
MSRIPLLTALSLTLILNACAGLPPTGHLESSQTIRDLFESAIILEDHAYYTMGSEVKPDAIIGVRSPYRLDSEIWSPVDLSEPQLRDWLFWFRIHETFTCTYSGGRLIAPDGQAVGIWYSKKILATIWHVEQPGDPEGQSLKISSFRSPEGSPCRYQERADDR